MFGSLYLYKNDRGQTLHLLSLMREHLTKEESELPKSISELEGRMRLGKG